MDITPVVAVDIGHSAVKCIYRTPHRSSRFLFPSTVVRATDLTDETAATRAAAETVRIGAASYFVGDTARVQGGPSVPSRLTDDWITTEEHKALLVHAWQTFVAESGVKGRALVVLGLPGRLYSTQKMALFEVARALLPREAEVKVIAQPKAPYHAFLQDEQGDLLPGRDLDATYAVVDVGRYTTDLAVIVSGVLYEAGLASTGGTQLAEQAMLSALGRRGIRATLADAERALERRYAYNRGQRVDLGAEADESAAAIAQDVIDEVERVVAPFNAQLAGLILAGGGAPLVAGALRAKWGAVLLPSDPRFEVAEGMVRWGLGVLRSRLEPVNDALAA
jgi:plasmid segregation protein ParM